MQVSLKLLPVRSLRQAPEVAQMHVQLESAHAVHWNTEVTKAQSLSLHHLLSNSQDLSLARVSHPTGTWP